MSSIPSTMKVVDHYGVGRGPQHIVPSWDLKTLWVTGSAEGAKLWGSLAAIDPWSGKVTKFFPMEDAYNMYFTPDGGSAIVVAESRRRLEFRDPHTMALQGALTIPECVGLNHADFSADGQTAVFTCEFSGSLAKIDVAARKLIGLLDLQQGGMPQDIRISPDGRLYYVANMMTDGVSLIDADTFTESRLHPDRHRHPRPLPQPRRQEALRLQPGIQQGRRPSARPWERFGHRFRDPHGRQDLADPRRRQPRHG